MLYGLRFYRLQKKHMAKLKTLLNEARRCISGLPRNTKLEKLHVCVPFPSFAEMAEQQEEIQNLKLKHTKQGRYIGELLDRDCEDEGRIPDHLPPWERIVVTELKPIPQKMGKGNKERRKRKAEQHEAEVEVLLDNPNITVCYTDAAHSDEGTAIAWHVPREEITNTETVTCGTAKEAEARAIASALQNIGESSPSNSKIIAFTNSQDVMRACKTHLETSTLIKDVLVTAIELEMP